MEREYKKPSRHNSSRFTADLDGQFCVARYEITSRTLRLAVDTFGIGRLFYCDRNGLLCFSDDVAALWSWFGAERRPCPESIDAYFTLFQIPAPLSGFADISQVPPNSVVTVANGRVAVQENIWMPQTTTIRCREEALRELEAELVANVTEETGSEKSAALLFSGGVDPMLLATVLHRSGVRLEHSFGEDGSEELEIAARRAASLKIPQQRWAMPWTTPTEVLLQRATLKWRMPICSMRIPYIHWFCEQVGKGRKYLVSGSGADGVFSSDPIWERTAKREEAHWPPHVFIVAANTSPAAIFTTPVLENI